MSKRKTADLQILYKKRIQNSYYGGPRYELVVCDELGIVFPAKTVSNGSIGYAISNKDVGNVYSFDYHFTKNGNIILECINE